MVGDVMAVSHGGFRRQLIGAKFKRSNTCACAVGHGGQNAHAFFDDVVQQGQLAELLAGGCVALQNAVQLVHQSAGYLRVLRQQEQRPR